MNAFISTLTTEVHTRLRAIEKEESAILKRSEQAIAVLEQAFIDLKEFTISYTFSDMEEEIEFFKHTKPKLFSFLIYYRKVYNIEVNRPKGGEEEQRKYLSQQLCLLKDYFDRNRDFYHYRRADEKYMDEHYFLRDRSPLHITMESFYFERDPRFSTVADFKMAKVMGHDKVEKYLCDELAKCAEHLNGTDSSTRVKLTWTAKKVFLIELIYALFWAEVFNHGKASLRDIRLYLQDVFNVDLGANPAKMYAEAKERKERTSFLDKLKKLLLNKMDEEDEK